jgi:transforming growth factor-beta-induced protein
MYIASRLSDYNPDYNPVSAGSDSKANATCISEYESLNLDVVCEQPGYSMFCEMLNTVGFMDVLSSGLYTIFAPTNEAFENALAGLGQFVDFTDRGLITSVVLQHLISGSAIYAKDLECDKQVEMANGDTNAITCEDDKFFIGGPGNTDSSSLPQIVEADAVGCNFVIHYIDEVILPE